MDPLAEVQAAHEVLYRVQRAGVWSRRVGVACLGIAAVPLFVLLLDALGVEVDAGPGTRRLARDSATLAMVLAVSAALGTGGALLARGGHRMVHIVGTRDAERIRRACGLAALGAGLASVPAAWTLVGTGLALLGFLQRNGPAAVIPAVYVGGCCLLPVALPLALTAVNGLLWLRLPAVVATVHEGREALRDRPVDAAGP